MDDPPLCINFLFHNLVHQSPRALLESFKLISDGGAAIAHVISTGTASAVIDGSYDNSRRAGFSAFIIAPNKDKGLERLESANFAIWLPDEQSAYRSELAGVIGVLTCVEVIVKIYKLCIGLITIALDGESALYQSDSEWPLSIDRSSFDYIQVIQNIIKELPISVKFHWVEGHQKENGLTLDWWTQSNDYVMAKQKSFFSSAFKPPC